MRFSLRDRLTTFIVLVFSVSWIEAYVRVDSKRKKQGENTKKLMFQSAGIIECTDCISSEG